MEWRLRRAAANDAEGLALIAGATFLEAHAPFFDRDDLLAHLAATSSPGRFRAWMADGHSIVALAETPAGRVPLGYTVLTRGHLPVEPREGDVELLRIYALATTWGSGLGAALMGRLIEDARAAGLGRILLGTHPDNLRAHRFYEKHGFAVVGGGHRFRVGDVEFDCPVYALEL